MKLYFLLNQEVPKYKNERYNFKECSEVSKKICRKGMQMKSDNCWLPLACIYNKKTGPTIRKIKLKITTYKSQNIRMNKFYLYSHNI